MLLIQVPGATSRSLARVAQSAKNDASNAMRQNQLAGSASTMVGNVVTRSRACKLLLADLSNGTRMVMTHPTMNYLNRSGINYSPWLSCALSANCRYRKPLCEHCYPILLAARTNGLLHLHFNKFSSSMVSSLAYGQSICFMLSWQ